MPDKKIPPKLRTLKKCQKTKNVKLSPILHKLLE